MAKHGTLGERAGIVFGRQEDRVDLGIGLATPQRAKLARRTRPADEFDDAPVHGDRRSAWIEQR